MQMEDSVVRESFPCAEVFDLKTEMRIRRFYRCWLERKTIGRSSRIGPLRGTEESLEWLALFFMKSVLKYEVLCDLTVAGALSIFDRI